VLNEVDTGQRIRDTDTQIALLVKVRARWDPAYAHEIIDIDDYED
jgi:hypothetical protein